MSQLFVDWRNMSSSLLVSLAIEKMASSQKELAIRLNVSPSQISKWKRGEYMSIEMQKTLSEIAGIGNRMPEFVTMAGSLENAVQWENLLRYLAKSADESSGTGYNTYRLKEEEEADIFYCHTFGVLDEMGVEIPKVFPADLVLNYETDDDDEWNLITERIHNNEISRFILSIYKSYVDIYGFYAAYISGTINKLDLFEPPICDFEPNLIALAACKVKEVPSIAKSFPEFRIRTIKNYVNSVELIKEKAFQNSVPLHAELMDLIKEDHDALGVQAEAESLGFTKSRLHPDIYMNELLVGMRVIHQVLPAILKKLGIEDEFKLDESELHLR